MRRSVAIVLGTIAGTSLLAGARLGTRPPDAAADGDGNVSAAIVHSGPASMPSGLASMPGGPVSGTRPAAVPSGASKHPTTAGHSPAPTLATAKPKLTPAPTASGPRDGTYTASAPVEGGKRGTLSMTVTISGNRITDIAASEADPTESNCYHSSCPKLRSQALTAQSARISAVSGATYTSKAYESALAAVLSAAKG